MQDEVFFTRLLQLVSEAEGLIGTELMINKANAWRASCNSLLTTWCGPTHIYSVSYQNLTENWKYDFSHKLDSYLNASLEILKALCADYLAGIRFNAEKKIDSNPPEFVRVLLRVEQLLQELNLTLRDRK